jgi:hypothetical protein
VNDDVKAAVSNPYLKSERLASIRARAEASTPGPWYVVRIVNGYIVTHRSATYDSPIVTSSGDRIDDGVGSVAQASANARFMAYARQDVPDLLTYIDALKQELSQCQKERTDLEVRLAALEQKENGHE